jgi:RNA polymerase sigma factor (sigma-70 family)
MTPFRRKPVKWDGNDENGRYKDRNGFKFDIMTKSVVNRAEEMPEYFLADTPEEADAIYSQYERLLNGLAYSYAIATGLSRADLFGEALIGLARAYRDWDLDRGGSFRTYAIFKIKDALNEFVRGNSATISVPAYIKKANANFCEIKSICDSYDIDWQILVIDQEIPIELEMLDATRCAKLVENLINAAERAKVDYVKFIDRISFIPEDADYKDQEAPEVHKRTEEQLEAALVVEKLKKHMSDDELTICDGIMKDKSFDQIGEEMNRSKAWVSGKLKGLREKIIDKMDDGTL